MDFLNLKTYFHPKFDKKLLLFIGSPRTGSTLLGQIINYHPNCLVANEFRLLNKIIVEEKNFKLSLKRLERYALKQFYKGLENDKKYGKVLHVYQKKWKNFEYLAKEPEFKKQEIKLIGDKKAGGNIQVINEYPNETKFFFEKIKQLYFIQIIRNPVHAAVSLMNSHAYENFEKAVNHILQQTVRAIEFSRQPNINYYSLYYEDLMEEPELEIRNIFNWLNIDVQDSWLKKIKEIISSSENKNIPKEYFNIYDNIIKKYNVSELKRYLNDNKNTIGNS